MTIQRIEMLKDTGSFRDTKLVVELGLYSTEEALKFIQHVHTYFSGDGVVPSAGIPAPAPTLVAPAPTPDPRAPLKQQKNAAAPVSPATQPAAAPTTPTVTPPATQPAPVQAPPAAPTAAAPAQAPAAVPAVGAPGTFNGMPIPEKMLAQDTTLKEVFVWLYNDCGLHDLEQMKAACAILGSSIPSIARTGAQVNDRLALAHSRGLART